MPENSGVPERSQDAQTPRYGKGYFLLDYANLRASVWARDRIILSDQSLKTLFTDFCRTYHEPGLYPDVEAAASSVTHFSFVEIAELARSNRNYIWMTMATGITGCPARYPYHRKILELFDYVAIAVGSVFNAGYFGIHLYRVQDGAKDPIWHYIARFYGGHICENTAKLDHLRREGGEV